MSIQLFGVFHLLTLVATYSIQNEPQCTMYEYNEKVHAKLIRVEHRLELMEEYMKSKIAEIDSKKLDMDLAFKTLSGDPKTSQTVGMEEMALQIESRLTDKITSTMAHITTQAGKTLNDLKDQQINNKAVFAHYYGSTTDHFTDGGFIIFETEVADTHNAYSTTTGCFDPPVDGLYLIIVQITVENGKIIVVNVEVNNSVISFARLQKSGVEGSQNIVTVVDLKSQDSMCLKAESGTSSGDLILNPTYRENFITITLIG